MAIMYKHKSTQALMCRRRADFETPVHNFPVNVSYARSTYTYSA